MIGPRRVNWLTLVLIGLLFLLMPAVLLVATLEVLFLFGDIDLASLSAVELLELYVLDFSILLVFAYVVYRLTLHGVRTRLPETLDRLEDDGPTDDDEGRR